jgi:hypothetical protein
MASFFILVLFGAGFGGLVSGLITMHFVATRGYRRFRNTVIFVLGYFCIGGASIGSLLLMPRILDRLGVARQSSRAALYAYTVSLRGACSSVFGARSAGESQLVYWARGIHEV